MDLQVFCLLQLTHCLQIKTPRKPLERRIIHFSPISLQCHFNPTSIPLDSHFETTPIYSTPTPNPLYVLQLYSKLPQFQFDPVPIPLQPTPVLLQSHFNPASIPLQSHPCNATPISIQLAL